MRHRLNAAILALAPPHDARSDAPGTWQELAQCRGRTILPIWDGASEKTWYSDARVNHAFRAWHDAAHIIGGFPFTLAGERAACEFQIAQLREAFPSIEDKAIALIRAEVIGQALHFAEFGFFPSDQLAFIGECLNDA